MACQSAWSALGAQPDTSRRVSDTKKGLDYFLVSSSSEPTGLGDDEMHNRLPRDC